MSIFLRIWLAFAVVLLVGGYLMINSLQEEIRPSIRQAIEDTLADNANLVAELVVDDFKQGRISRPEFDAKIQSMLHRPLQGQIWDIAKSQVNQQLYITNAQGIVIYDSLHQAIGKDYSRWNDVWLTLHGRYGVRSTRTNPQDESSSVMYVAAPIKDGQQILGVVTLAKAGVMVQPFIERARDKMLRQGLLMVGLSLLLSMLVAWWLRLAIYRVSAYAKALAPATHKPIHFYAARELNDLVAAIDTMRQELEGKAYVENYVHTLTHELKSPLTAIQASAELLQEELPPADRARFSLNIRQQTDKLLLLIERLLILATLEKRQQPLHKDNLCLADLLTDVLTAFRARSQQKNIQLNVQVAPEVMITGEAFWLKQALTNVMDNALDFMPHGALLQITYVAEQKALKIYNQGPCIPDYALTQVFERFYSLPRPQTGRKSSGLGLTLVREVMAWHGGTVAIANQEQGVCVSLMF